MKNKKSTIIAWAIMIAICCEYWAWADLTSHTEALLDTLLLTIDPTHDGSGSAIVFKADIDDSPVNGETDAPISSGWAYRQTYWDLNPEDGSIQHGTFMTGVAGANISQFDMLRKDPTSLKWHPFIAAVGTKVAGADTVFAMAMASASTDEAITVVSGEFMVYSTDWSGLGSIANSQIYPSTTTAGDISATKSSTTGDLQPVLGMGVAGGKIIFRLPALPSVEVGS